MAILFYSYGPDYRLDAHCANFGQGSCVCISLYVYKNPKGHAATVHCAADKIHEKKDQEIRGFNEYRRINEKASFWEIPKSFLKISGRFMETSREFWDI